jgi:uncharacterized protein (DUF433 family)
MGNAIINNRIAGTRITVWDITYYLANGRSPEYIAEILPVTEEQVRAAIQYIEEHKEEVMAVHRQIEERHARGNTPEVEAKLAESQAKRLALMEQFRKAKCLSSP